MFRRQGYAFALAAILSLIAPVAPVALVARPITPANNTIRILSGDPGTPPAVRLATLLTASTWIAHRRR